MALSSDTEPRRALVLCGDKWHAPQTARAGLAPLAAAGFACDWSERTPALPVEGLAAYTLVVLTKSNHVAPDDERPWLTEEGAAALAGYVRGGRGLAVIHSGAAGYADRPALRALIGGAFDQHPPQCPVTLAPRPDHNLAAGRAPFTVTDEHYFMHMDDPTVDLFLTSASAHGTQPAGWTRTEGAGRVCVLTPGHNLEVWTHPGYQALLLDALRWCSAAESEIR